MCVPIRSQNIWKISKFPRIVFIMSYEMHFDCSSSYFDSTEKGKNYYWKSFCSPFIISISSNPMTWFHSLNSKKTVELIHSKKDEISSELIGSWTVHVGDMDQVLHLWRYTGGFEKIDTAHRVLGNDKVTMWTLRFESECIISTVISSPLIGLHRAWKGESIPVAFASFAIHATI